MTDSFVPSGTFEWNTVMKMNIPKVPFYLEPYIPQHGIVLIHGKWGTYKTPLTFNMALAIAKGEDIWGLSVTQAERILYVEMDTHSTILIPRLQKLDPQGTVRNVLHIGFYQPGPNAIHPAVNKQSKVAWEQLYKAHNGYVDTDGSRVAGFRYNIVFFDSLRCLHGADDKGSETPHILYNALMTAFPGAVIVLVHHDRKSRADDTAAMSSESASGSQAWVNHATVAIHVGHANKAKRQIVVEQTKSQASEEAPPLLLQVEEGIKMETCQKGAHKDVNASLEQLEKLEPGCSARMKDYKVAAALGISTRTAQRRRLDIERAAAQGKSQPVH